MLARQGRQEGQADDLAAAPPGRASSSPRVSSRRGSMCGGGHGSGAAGSVAPGPGDDVPDQVQAAVEEVVGAGTTTTEGRGRAHEDVVQGTGVVGGAVDDDGVVGNGPVSYWREPSTRPAAVPTSTRRWAGWPSSIRRLARRVWQKAPKEKPARPPAGCRSGTWRPGGRRGGSVSPWPRHGRLRCRRRRGKLGGSWRSRG